ncbi:MurR/RpiR family transcriptional regulator [Yaniella halotolerans]|uniref:MurR/RpiR family transcriptional regulator n=1 Tax=Yaniella halotolerans TaxID=225453 RepID=UPI0003B40BAE|nr:MurR/RpiR family transcriptional regulator [Yaniella halotolerans]
MSHKYQQSTPKTRRAFNGHLRAAFSRLSPTEQRVVEVLLADTNGIAESSALAIAQQARTSSATVVRTAQKLGYAGYNALRSDIIRFGMQEPIGDTVGDTARDDAEQDIMHHVFSTAITELQTASDTLDRQQFSDAVEVLDAARKIMFIGSGESSMPAQEAALRFMMHGRDAIAPTDVLQQQFGSRLLTSRDALVAVSYSGANKHTLEAVEAARISRVPVIGITSNARTPLAELADMLLVMASPTAATEPLIGRIAHSLVLNGLNHAVSLQGQPQAFGPSEALADVFARTLKTPQDDM